MEWDDKSAQLTSLLERADGTSPEWLDEFILSIVNMNSSEAIRAVVLDDPNRAKDVFRVSFWSVWTNETYDSLLDQIVHAFECILNDPRAHTGVIENIMGLIEFMALEETPIPIRTSIVAVAAERHELYAKALFFREQEYVESRALPTSECVEALIAVNIKLGNVDSVHGLLRSSAAKFVRVRASWHEKLENWSAALSSYSVRLLEDQTNREWISGRMRCLSALGEWDRLLESADMVPSSVTPAFQAEACFHLQKWDDLRGCLNLYKNLLQGQFETSVYESAVAIRGNNLLQAREHSKRAREILGPVLMPPAQRQNKRAMIRYLNYLEVTQLDEIIDFLSSATPSNAKAILEDLKQTWNQRLLDLDYSLDVWRRLIPIRAILLSPTGEDIDTWVRFSTLSRKKQNLVLSQRIVQRLQTARPDYHGVILSEIKNQYAQGRINDAIDGLESFLHTENLISQCTPYLLAKCFLALGMWLPATDPRVAQYVGRSVQLDPKGYKAQSTQALIKFREAQTRGFGPHISEAVESLFRAIQLASRVQLPDVLRLLTLWFSFYGQDMFLDEQFEKGFSSVPLLTWTHAIPQILARLRSRRVKLRDSIHRLLVRLGLEYPQSVVFALTVASASEANDSLVVHSKQILSKISEQYPDLVQQCELVARELVRIASSWIEQWCAALEEASRLYFVDKDLGGMLRKLSAIHSQMNRNRPETPQETSFAQKYGEELEMAWSWVRKYIETHNSFFLDQAWGIYYQVFQKLHQQVGLVKQVVLARVSPQLNILHDTCLLLPSSSEVFIHSFLSSIEIVSSKQRPRAMQIVGSDGRSYKYLLKANEDLKQDERVMQLFGLINTVITDSVASRRRSGVFPTTPGIETLEDVHLKRYAVVPLSQNAGLIEWVDECDTLHALIKSRRDVLGIPVSLEHNLMRHIYTQYEDLPLTERVQVFEYALSETSGTELRDSMWLSSRGCETWLRRRSMYARSLAVNSIVGYFLGLGDRHPSNLMIDRNSGQVIHIDFGDCFDVAATRDRYPEKVPFRLTRQLVNALEACGVEGTFRVTAERMMDLIRKNSDSIMAMLEAFIYDPLLTWRILPDGKDAESLNARAKEVVERVHAKLAGEDLSVTAHVDQLIREAVAHENLCQCYLGWCPFW